MDIGCLQNILPLLGFNSKDIVCGSNLGSGTNAYDAGEVYDVFLPLLAGVLGVAELNGGWIRLHRGEGGGNG